MSSTETKLYVPPKLSMPINKHSSFGNKERNQNQRRKQYKNSSKREYGNYYSNNSAFKNYRRGNRFGNSNPLSNERSTTRNVSLESELFDSLEVTKGINFDKYENISVEVSGEDIPESIDTFDNIDNIHPQLLWNIKRSGYTKPTPIQKYSFSISVAKRDIMGCAQTGSGKTAAFLFPMIQMLLESGGGDKTGGRYVHSYGNATYCPSGLILVPTRELTQQIQIQARKFLYRTGMRSCPIYGGVDKRVQIRDLEKGADIIIATPGRLTDLMQIGHINLERIRFLVLDEADRMLDMGFLPQIQEILSKKFKMPSKGERQTMMFSATFPRNIQELALDFMENYIFVAVGRVGATVEYIKQHVIQAENYEKQNILIQKMRECEGRILIFVKMKKSADYIHYFLKSNGVESVSIHGDHKQSDREYSLKLFKKGACKVMVATDVASRGLDIPDITHVFNYDMPTNIDDYVHRIGRTGRCGNEGTAISLISQQDIGKVLGDLIDVLSESKNDIPDWLRRLARERATGRANRGYHRNNNSRDSRTRDTRSYQYGNKRNYNRNDYRRANNL